MQASAEIAALATAVLLGGVVSGFAPVQPFIIAIQVFAIGLLCFQPGAIGLDLFQRLVVALPAVGLGTLIGASMFAKVNDRVFRYCALFIILASGCLMAFSSTL